LRLARHFHINPNLILEASVPETQILTNVYNQNRQEQAQLYFSVADYIIYKLSDYKDESAQSSGWKLANEIRQQFTGENLEDSSLGQGLTAEQSLQYLELRDQSGISFEEYVNQYIIQ
jgi:hypothetical protein